MSRSPNIYGPRTNKEVARVVKNFNARRRYEIRKNPDAENWLPEKASTKAIKKSVNTRADLNRELSQMSKFTAETAQPVFLDKGVVMSQWELKTIESNILLSNKRRAKRLKEINPNTKTGTMKAAEQHNLRPIKFDPNKLSYEEIQYKKRLARNESRKNYQSVSDLLYKDNYIQAIRDNLGEYAEKIVSLIKDVTPSQMLNAYKGDPVLNIKFISDPLKRAQIAQEVLEHWQEFLGLDVEVNDENDDWDEEE